MECFIHFILFTALYSKTAHHLTTNPIEKTDQWSFEAAADLFMIMIPNAKLKTLTMRPVTEGTYTPLFLVLISKTLDEEKNGYVVRDQLLYAL